MPRYICLHCYHEWDSHPYNVNREILRCSKCHRRQGVNNEKFRKAVDAAKTAMRKVIKSPPPYPPPLEAFAYIPVVMRPVLEIARKEFPSPLVPVALLVKIIEQAVAELKEETQQQPQEGEL